MGSLLYVLVRTVLKGEKVELRVKLVELLTQGFDALSSAMVKGMDADVAELYEKTMEGFCQEMDLDGLVAYVTMLTV